MADMNDQAWKEFYGSTTLHGFRFIFVKGSRFRRCFWLFIVVTALLWVGLQLYRCLAKFNNYPISTLVKEEYRGTVPFPSVSICVRSPVLLSDLRRNAYLRVLAHRRRMPKPKHWTPKMIVTLLRVAERRGKYGQVILNSTQPPKWFIRKATFNKVQIPLADFQTELQDRTGYCYTFNDNTSQQLSVHSGLSGGLEMRFKLPVKTNILPLPERANSIWVILKEPGESPNLDSGIHVPAGFGAYIAIKRQEVNLLRPPFPKSHCTTQKSLHIYPRYSNFGCRKECLENMTMQRCNCSNILSQRGLAEECTSSKQCRNKTELKMCEQRCRDSCDSVSYIQRVSYRHFIGEMDADRTWLKAYGESQIAKYKDREQNYQFVKDHFIYLRIYYEDMSVRKISEMETYDLAALLGDLGGELGLFIGASVITWFEFVDFFLVWLWSKLSQIRNNRERQLQGKLVAFGSTESTPAMGKKLYPTVSVLPAIIHDKHVYSSPHL